MEKRHVMAKFLYVLQFIRVNMQQVVNDKTKTSRNIILQVWCILYDKHTVLKGVGLGGLRRRLRLGIGHKAAQQEVSGRLEPAPRFRSCCRSAEEEEETLA